MLKRYPSLFAALFIALFFISCQKELSGDLNVLPGTGGATGTCKACAYIPWCQGSVYTYIDTSGGTGSPVTSSVNIVSDTIIDGKVFQKFSNPGADGYYNCTAGVSTVIAYSVPVTGGTVTKLEQTLLKANEAVGATWSNSLANGLGQNVDYNYSLVEKGLTRTVLGVTYTDVSHVHQSTSMTVPVLGTIVMAEADSYYAKNIGLIDNINFSTNPFGGAPVMSLHRVLKTYLIP